MGTDDRHVTPGWVPAGDEERVWLRAAPSRNLLLAGFGVSFVILVLMSIVVGSQTDLQTGRRLSLVMIVLTVGVILFAYYLIVRLDYAVTDRRAYVGTGIRTKAVTAQDLATVTDVVVDRPTWQQWIGTGNVRFVSEDGSDLRFAYVDDPYGVYQQVLDQLELTTR